MAFYRRVHTPNSPLMPLSPMPVVSPSMFLSPYTTSIRSRRSFTPNHLNVLPPPSLSPIQAILSSKRKPHNPHVTESPRRTFDFSSVKKSIKKIRSSARKEARTGVHTHVPLQQIRRSLFAADSPPILQLESPGGSSSIPFVRPPTPHSKYILTPKRGLTPTKRYSYADQSFSPSFNNNNNTTTSILEETFTVLSILKERNMQKYANLFVREEVDLFVFLMLDDQDMIELGIEEKDRPILMKAINYYTDFFGNADKSIS